LADVDAYLRELEDETDRPRRVRKFLPRRVVARKGGGGLATTVSLAAGQGNPVNAGPINFTVAFSKPVTGFTNADVSFAGSTVGGTLAAAVTGTGPAYNVAVTGMTGNGLVQISVPAGAAADALTGAPTPASSSAAYVTLTTTGPSVTINQAASQGDPTGVSPVNFTVVFSASVSGFTGSDISFTGSTAPGTLAAAVTGGPSTFNVAVTGMTGAGNVVASIPAAVVTDLAGNANSASSSVGTTPAFASAGTYLTYASHTNSTLVAPAGIANGDLLVAYLFNLGPNPTAPAVTAPAGWTEIPGSPSSVTDGSANGRYHIFSKIASNESGDYTFTHATSNSCGVVCRYTGADQASPLAPLPSVNTGTGTTATANGITTGIPNTLVIFTEHDWASVALDSVVPPGTTPTFTERTDAVLLYIADGTLATAGPTGNKAHTNNSASGEPWAAYLIGLKPSGAGDNTVAFTATGAFGWELDATNTGLAGAGIDKNTLPLYTGTDTPTAGTTISLKKITLPTMFCAAGNITFDRCWFAPSGAAFDTRAGYIFGYDPDLAANQLGDVTFLDCDIDGSAITSSDVFHACAFRGAGSLYRCNIFGFGGAVAYVGSNTVTTSTIEHCYCHDNRGGLFGTPEQQSHNEQVFIFQFGGTSFNIRNNKFLSFTGSDSAAVFIQCWDVIQNVVLEGNALDTIGWDLALEQHGQSYANMSCISNRFGTSGIGPAYVDGGTGWAVWTNNFRWVPANPNQAGAVVPSP